MSLVIKPLPIPEFDALREPWNELLGRSACDSVFLRWEWMYTWWKHFQQNNRRLFILTARRGDRLVGLAPFYIETAGLLGTRTLKWCSEELSPDYLDLIAEKGEEPEFAREAVRYLTEHTGEWDLIALDFLRAQSLLATDAALLADYVHAVGVSHHCPYITIERPFDDYYKERPGLTKYLFHKKLRHLFDKMKVTHTIVSDDPGLAKGLDDLFLLHEMRARQMNLQSNFLMDRVRRFHHEVSRLFFKEHILSLHFLYDGEKPVSAYYAFIYDRKEFLYQTGFDPAYSKWSAGAVLLFFCIHRAFEDRLREFDFLKGTEGYKRLWSNGMRDEMKLTVYNRNGRGTFWRTMGVLRSAGRRVKRALWKKPPSNALAPSH